MTRLTSASRAAASSGSSSGSSGGGGGGAGLGGAGAAAAGAGLGEATTGLGLGGAGGSTDIAATPAVAAAVDWVEGGVNRTRWAFCVCLLYPRFSRPLIGRADSFSKLTLHTDSAAAAPPRQQLRVASLFPLLHPSTHQHRPPTRAAAAPQPAAAAQPAAAPG